MTRLAVTIDGFTYDIQLSAAPLTGETVNIEVNGEAATVTVPETARAAADIEWLIVGDRPYEIVFDADLRWIKAYDGLHLVEILDQNERSPRPHSGDGRIKAPIPGLITRVLVEPGELVRADQPIIMLEAMKMENEIRAPYEGVISAISATPGETVVRGQVLAEIT